MSEGRSGRPRPGRRAVIRAAGLAAVACLGVAIYRDAMPWRSLPRALRSGRVEARVRAAHALGEPGAVDPELAIRSLTAALGDAEEEVRLAAAQSLPAVILRASPEGPARQAAREAMEALAGCLAGPDREVRRAAVQAIAAFAPVAPPSAVPGLVAALRVGEPADRDAAAFTLGAVLAATTDPAAFREGAGALVGASRAPERQVRLAAVTALGRINQQPKGLRAPAPLEALDDPEPMVRVGAAAAVGGPRPEDRAIAPLLRGMDDPDPLVASACSQALLCPWSEPPSSAVVPALVEALGRREDWARRVAIHCLQRLGPAAVAAVPALVATLREPIPPGSPPTPDQDPACWAANALGRIAPKTDAAGGAIAALTASLGSEHRPRRQAAAEALCFFGPAAAGSVPAIASALREAAKGREGPEIAWALAYVAPGTPSAGRAIAALVDALAADDRPLRESAARCLAKFGPAAAVAVPALAARLRRSIEAGGSPDESSAMLSGLAEVAPGSGRAGPAVAALRDALKAPDRGLRLQAIRALGGFGPAAADALADLRPLASDPDAKVRDDASKALAAIEPGPKP